MNNKSTTLSKQLKKNNHRNIGKIDTLNSHINDHLLSWLGTGTWTSVEVWANKISPSAFLLKCMFQVRKVRGHIYICVRGIGFGSFYDFSIRFQNCFDNVVFFVFHSITSTEHFFVQPAHMSSRLCGTFLYINIIISWMKTNSNKNNFKLS